MHSARAILALLLIVASASADQMSEERYPEQWRALAPFTYEMPEPDTVELHRLDPAPDATGYKETRKLTGDEAHRIGQIWRSQKWSCFHAACHSPPYAITFYRDGKKLFSCTICFHCSNIQIANARLFRVGFGDKDPASELLHNLFRNLWEK